MKSLKGLWKKENSFEEVIWPLETGFFFKNLESFKNPIPFIPPKGAMSVFRAPTDLVIEELRKAGYKVTA